MSLPLLYLIIGLALLTVGGSWLVKGATTLAVLARLSIPVIGLTVVAMGTSLPELAVSMWAAARGSTEMAYGNIVGSNIFNVGIVAGVASLFATLPVSRYALRREYPFMLGVTAVAIAFSLNGSVGHIEGAAMFGGLIIFTWVAIRLARQGELPPEVEELDGVLVSRDSTARLLPNLGLIAVGIAALTGGARLTVIGGVQLAELVGVSERVIGLTVLAMGTSLPEVATSLVAVARKQPELVLGNVIGSNIFNLLGILGLTGLVFPVAVNHDALSYDNWVMLAFSVALLPMMARKKVGPVAGGLLLLLFAGYTWVLLTR
ncbi:MAG: calcium/sodium antiporter [Gemmatimonadales bacterium]